jgi:diguanylate cyclase (GGDEF)-like protein
MTYFKCILKDIMLIATCLSIINYFTYLYISCTISNEVLLKTIWSIDAEISHLFIYIKNAIVISTILTIIIVFLILYKLASHNYKALYFDYLTGINNKRFFDIKISKHIRKLKIKGTSLTILMMDIDFFKGINDNYGHDVGDMVLQHVAKLIHMNIRKQDICFRVGGDEFAVILPETNTEQASLISERIMEKVRNCAFIIDEKTMKNIDVTLSIGIVEWQDDMKAEQFYKKVDDVLYVSKRNGRNRITAYDKLVYFEVQ